MLKNISLEELVQYSQIVSPILAFAAIVVSWFIYLNQKGKERKEKAIQIGLDIESIVVLIAYVNMVLELESPDLVAILHRADKRKMRRFDRAEIRLVYSDDELWKIRSYFNKNIYSQYFVGASPKIFKVSSRNLLIARQRYYQLFDKDVHEIPKESLDDFLTFEFQQKIVQTLNRLETASLMMVKKIADEKSVYNSMEDIFLEFIARFYYYISTINADLSGADRKLKNVIKMFNKWEKRAERQKRFREINPFYW